MNLKCDCSLMIYVSIFQFLMKTVLRMKNIKNVEQPVKRIVVITTETFLANLSVNLDAFVKNLYYEVPMENVSAKKNVLQDHVYLCVSNCALEKCTIL